MLPFFAIPAASALLEAAAVVFVSTVVARASSDAYDKVVHSDSGRRTDTNGDRDE